jgi:hypothetical protein
VQYSQWVQPGCSAVPAAAAPAQGRRREVFSRKSSARTKGERCIYLLKPSTRIDEELDKFSAAELPAAGKP